MRAFRTRGLYTFYPLFEVYLCTLALCMVSIQEWFLIKRTVFQKRSQQTFSYCVFVVRIMLQKKTLFNQLSKNVCFS